MSLRFNNLDGTVPSELGRLDRLKDLKLDSNLITGEIPFEICQLAGGEQPELVVLVDCNEVTCSCCSEC